MTTIITNKYDRYVICVCDETEHVMGEIEFDSEAEADECIAAHDYQIANYDTTTGIDGDSILLVFVTEPDEDADPKTLGETMFLTIDVYPKTRSNYKFRCWLRDKSSSFVSAGTYVTPLVSTYTYDALNTLLDGINQMVPDDGTTCVCRLVPERVYQNTVFLCGRSYGVTKEF